MNSAKSTCGEPPYLVLVNSDPSKTYDLLRKKTILVARAGFNGDLEIYGDSSVSRSHAEISCIKKTINGEVKCFMQVVDKKSKFGTYVNEGITSNKRIESESPVILSHGDNIRFGLSDCGSFRLLVRAFNVCASALKRPEKSKLESTLKKSKTIYMHRDIDEQTTHLCMNSITITEKALRSLAVLRPIVTIQYFIDLYKAFLPNSSTDLPFTIDYLPQVAENLLNHNSVSLDINPKRQGLLSGKTFICSTDGQMNRISKVVNAAGGNVLHHLDCQNISISDILKSDTFIFMQQDLSDTETRDQYNLMLEQLQNMNKRPIPENDIGLAIIFASTDKHCNPNFSMSLVNQSQSNVTKSQVSTVLAGETEEIKIVDSSQMCSLTCVPDSLPQTIGSIKRPLEVIMDSDEIMSPYKRATPSNEKINEFEDISEVENIEPLKRIVKPMKPIVSSMPVNSDSCVTVLPSFLDISKENDLSNSLQVSVVDKTMSNANNIHSDLVENNMISKKRKLSSSLSDNECDDLFDYMDIDEVQEVKKKKPKKQYNITEPSFQSTLHQASSEIEHLQIQEQNTLKAIDPFNIMNLLANVKGTGQFIDSSKLPDKASINLYKDSEYDYLTNSVIIQTVSMVKPRPTKTQNFLQESHSHLKNFKQFKKKGPAIRIPHIVPMEISHIN